MRGGGGSISRSNYRILGPSRVKSDTSEEVLVLGRPRAMAKLELGPQEAFYAWNIGSDIP